MAFDGGFNFRDTAGYVTDGANQTYVLRTDIYPVTRGGWTFGWVTTSPSGSIDRDATVDSAGGHRLAGINYGGPTCTFRVDLPATGVVTVHTAIGDWGGGGVGNETVVVKDNATTLLTIGPHNIGAAPAAETFWDASDVSRNPSTAWISNEVGAALTFATTTFKMDISSATTWVFAHLRLVQAGGAGGFGGLLSTGANRLVQGV